MAVEPIEIPLCGQIPDFPELLELILPGGISFRQLFDMIANAPNQFTGSLNLFQLLQPAVTPLIPVFDVIDTVTAIVNCLKAVAGPPPDILALGDCIPDLIEKLDKLLQYTPPFSIPILAKGLLDALIRMFRGLQDQLLNFQSQLGAAASVIERASELEDAQLEAIALCKIDNVNRETANVVSMLESLGHLFGLINLLLEMIGSDPIPEFSDLAGSSLEGLSVALEDAIVYLQKAHDAIIVPGSILELAQEEFVE